ncbi:hypothetical protein [Neobacillus niacini]|uniref:hypothetical protein n=1 Tax=Neobacillus niacini TaxID=86668 RepID=UPI002040BA11|nr:hypothetical protein [Neobacillus niacini]MCM3693413.1 hypothetical protein [Neobacillus niacini]
MSYYQIGNFSLPSLWLAVLTTLFGASLLYKLLTGAKVGEWYWNSFFLYFLAWKLSYILFNITMFIDLPLSILYFNGGTKGHFIGLTLLSLYLLFLAGKKHPGLQKEAGSIFLLFFFTYEVISKLLEMQWIEVFSHFVVFAGYIVLFLFLKRKSKPITGPIIIVLILIELLLFSIFSTLFSFKALTLTWIGLTVLSLFKKMDKEAELLE